jgi:hypothetical protein
MWRLETRELESLAACDGTQRLDKSHVIFERL